MRKSATGILKQPARHLVLAFAVGTFMFSVSGADSAEAGGIKKRSSNGIMRLGGPTNGTNGAVRQDAFGGGVITDRTFKSNDGIRDFFFRARDERGPG